MRHIPIFRLQFLMRPSRGDLPPSIRYYYPQCVITILHPLLLPSMHYHYPLHPSNLASRFPSSYIWFLLVLVFVLVLVPQLEVDITAKHGRPMGNATTFRSRHRTRRWFDARNLVRNISVAAGSDLCRVAVAHAIRLFSLQKRHTVLAEEEEHGGDECTNPGRQLLLSNGTLLLLLQLLLLRHDDDDDGGGGCCRRRCCYSCYYCVVMWCVVVVNAIVCFHFLPRTNLDQPPTNLFTPD